jgi:hypothetical protein
MAIRDTNGSRSRHNMARRFIGLDSPEFIRNLASHALLFLMLITHATQCHNAIHRRAFQNIIAS